MAKEMRFLITLQTKNTPHSHNFGTQTVVHSAQQLDASKLQRFQECAKLEICLFRTLVRSHWGPLAVLAFGFGNAHPCRHPPFYRRR